MSNVIVTTRIEQPLAGKLDVLAGRTERSRAWLIAKAIHRYVDEELARLDFIQEGIADLDQGRSISQEEMEAWFDARYRSIAAE